MTSVDSVTFVVSVTYVANVTYVVTGDRRRGDRGENYLTYGGRVVNVRYVRTVRKCIEWRKLFNVQRIIIILKDLTIILRII